MPRLIDMEGVIQHYGSLAVANYTRWDKAIDENALEAIDKSDLADRREIIRSWLERLSGFQGFSAAQRNAAATAILEWADARRPYRRLDKITALSDAHGSMMQACSDALDNPRDLTSLASKALWLCYPEDVPIFDSIAHRALCVISKLEGDMPPVNDGHGSRYGNFIHPWTTLYDRYSAALRSVDMESCKHPVRIFDGILLCIGANTIG